MAEIIEMPKLSDTMTSGTLVSWLKNEGDAVAAGDMIAEVETDKATMEVECFEDGVLLKQYIGAGDSIEIGGAICAVGEAGEDIPEVSNSGSGSAAPAPQEEKAEAAPPKAAAEPEPAPTPVASPAPSSSGDSDLKVSPLAKKVAADLGVSLGNVSGTGPGGRIVRADVEAAAKNGTSAAAPSAPAGPAPALLTEETLPVSGMRSAIARTLVGSKTQAPHFYLQIEVDGAPLSELRASLNGSLAELPPEQGGIKFTVNDLTLRAAAEAVRRVPAINRSWMGDTIKQHGSVHLAFGVAIDDGLVTPVIRDAHAKSLSQISVEAKGLIKKARGKKLKPDEMSGSTLTVTNLGMFGISDFYGIINPPNAAILSVGATIKTPVVADDGTIQVGYRMKVGLSGDHRVIDGAVGAQYLAALRDILEAPATMLV